MVTVFSSRSITGFPAPSTESGSGALRLPHRTVGTGSGFIISADGWIVTNDHVVGGADKVTVRLHDGREFVGAVRRDFRSDIALIKITAPLPFPTAALGDSDTVKIGHWAIAIGSPYRYEGSLSVGVISSLSRSHTIRDSEAPGDGRFYPTMLQTDAAINPGNSGGPLCDLDGEVIGINTAIESETGGSIGIGFAIPINAAKRIVEALRTQGFVTYGYLGVNPVDVNPTEAAALKVARGALISEEPDAGTPAGRAGLHAGDVVTSIDGKAVGSELDLRNMIAAAAPGSSVSLGVVREGKTLEMAATLTAAANRNDVKPRLAGKPHLGVEVQPLTKKLAEEIGVPTSTPGVAIRSVDPDTSAADVPEMAENTIILRVNGTDTPTIARFQTALAGVKSGDALAITCLVKDPERGAPRKRFVVVTVD